jgi:hypothetical protein
MAEYKDSESQWVKEERREKGKKDLKKAGSTVGKKMVSVSSEDARERSRVYYIAEKELKELGKEKYHRLKNK